MAQGSLARRFRPKQGDRAAVVNPPKGYARTLGPLPDEFSLSRGLQGSFDWIQAFVESQTGLEKTLPRLVKQLKPLGLLWISSPKGSSGIQTDLTRDEG
jgi:hypothetical protein